MAKRDRFVGHEPRQSEEHQQWGNILIVGLSDILYRFMKQRVGNIKLQDELEVP